MIDILILSVPLKPICSAIAVIVSVNTCETKLKFHTYY